MDLSEYPIEDLFSDIDIAMNIPSNHLELTNNKQKRLGEYSKESIAELLKKTESLPSKATPEMERQLKEAQENNPEKNLVNYLITTQHERVDLLKKTGEMKIEWGYSLQTNLTDKEKKDIPLLNKEDIAEIKRIEREFQGEKYLILSYKEKGKSMTAIQVPKKIKEMKYSDTELVGNSKTGLSNFKNKDRYPAFLTEEKLKTPINQERVVMGKESENYKNDKNSYLRLLEKWDSEDIIRHMAKQGKWMQSITDNIILTQLIKGRFGDDYLSEEFTNDNFDPKSSDKKKQDIQKKLKEIEEEFQINFKVDQNPDGKDSSRYLKRDYSIYKRKTNRDGEKESYNGFLRGGFDSAYSGLGGPASVALDWYLVYSDSGWASRPCV
jgi:hypothetical protein